MSEPVYATNSEIGLQNILMNREKLLKALVGLTILGGLFIVSRYNYLVFHTLAEFFAISIAWSLFIVLWNTREFIENKALVLLGVAYLFIGGIDLIHTLSYKGMGVLSPETGANPATQLWIFARYVESVTLCLFASMAIKNIEAPRAIFAYSSVMIFGMLSIFYWENFPVCFHEGVGLTAFKVYSEYLICLVLILALVLLRKNRHQFDLVVYRPMHAAVILTIFAELAFTFYVSVYGLSNLFGHFLKIVSFYFVYLALIRSGLRKPYSILFNKTKQEEIKYRSIFESSPIAIERYDIEGRLLEANEACLRIFGVSDKNQIQGFKLFDDPNLPEDHKHELVNGNMVRYQTKFDFDKVRSSNFYQTSCEGSIWIDVLISPIKDFLPGYLVHVQDITDQVKAEEKLRQSESKFRDLFDNASDAIFIHDIDGRILECNAVARDLYGYNRKEMLRIKMTDIQEQNDEPALPDRSQEDQKNRKIVFESIHRKKDGTSFPVEIHTRTIDYEGKPCLLSVVRDITERLEKEFQHTQIINTAIDAFWMVGLDGTIREVNPAGTRMLGYSESELLKMSVTDLDVSETHDETQRRIRQLERDGYGLFETQHRCKDDSIIDVEVSACHFTSGGGGFFAFVRDITQRKQIERMDRINKFRLDLVHAIATMNEATEKEICDFVLERMLDLSRSKIGFLGFLAPDEKIMQIHSWSSSVMRECDVHDKPLSFPIAESGLWGQAVHQRRAMIYNDYHQDIPGKHDLPEGHVAIERFMCVPVKEGERIVAVAAVGNKAGDYQQFEAEQLGLLMDSWWEQVRRGRLNEERARFQEQLQRIQRMESIGTLAGGIAHDFNNLLFPIIGMAEMLTEDLDSGSVLYENAKDILKAGKRGGDLVKQILAFSRQSEHKMIPVGVQQVLREVVKLSRATIPTDIDIREDIQKDCGLVLADPSQIHQVAMNLITNAYHALQESGGKISVRLCEQHLKDAANPTELLAPGRYAVLSVADNGPGIPSTEMGKIFEPYFTTKEPGKGTGLGLAVVYGIVKEHQGEIVVTSQPGLETRFDVYLPLLEESQDVACDSTETSIAGGSERILLVDDDEAITVLEQKMLERSGYRVTPKSGSREALEAFRKNPNAFDLVITDMTMPKMTGDQLARQLMEIRPDIPVIICTGFSERMDKDRAYSIGIRGFLMKPVVKSEMNQMVRKVLDKAKG